MRTVTATYQEIPTYDYGNKKCCECGKTITKKFKEYQTINPWNNKTPQEIREENRAKLLKAIPEWTAKEESCAACQKLATPDIAVDLVTQEEWCATSDIRDDIFRLEKMLSEKRRELERQFKGRHIKVDYKGKERIGQIDYLVEYNSNSVWFDYYLVRSDMKGITDIREQKSSEKVFEAKRIAKIGEV